MDQFVALTFVFLAGFVTIVTTGVGTTPSFFVSDVNDRWNVALWGVASGIMMSAPLFGLVFEGLANGAPLQLDIGMLAGVVLILVAHHIVEGAKVNPKQYGEVDFRKLLLILGILAVHSFPEGVATGVSLTDLDLDGSFQPFGFVVPLLTVFMTLAISIHNIPEGLAISIPLWSMNASNWKLIWWTIFSSLPQPIGAVIAFYFVRVAREFLPFGFGFAAGAMMFLVLTEFIPKALEFGKRLPRGDRVELLAGLTADFAVMVPLAPIWTRRARHDGSGT